jgi:hypothetical protein
LVLVGAILSVVSCPFASVFECCVALHFRVLVFVMSCCSALRFVRKLLLDHFALFCVAFSVSRALCCFVLSCCCLLFCCVWFVCCLYISVRLSASLHYLALCC